jgi:7-carboxy-7-deazaguanine synthase
VNQLRITEIFLSLQGETRTVGFPTAFIRLTGCPLRCTYCDTAYAFYGGRLMSLNEILTQVKEYQVQHVTVTGGEPLAQKSCLGLLQALCDSNYEVSLETSGALDISAVDPRVIKIVDIKTPDSGEVECNRLENIKYLSTKDSIKFVICSRDDYDWAKNFMATHHLTQRCEVLLSPSHNQLQNKALAEWMLADKLQARFQVQLHKYIWGDVPGK